MLWILTSLLALSPAFASPSDGQDMMARLLLCERHSARRASTRTVRRFNSGDCDDEDPALHPNTDWYFDGDGDGFGVSTPQYDMNGLSESKISAGEATTCALGYMGDIYCWGDDTNDVVVGCADRIFALRRHRHR